MMTGLASARRFYVVRGAVSVLLTTGLALLSVITALFGIMPQWRFLPILSFIVFWAGISAALVYASTSMARSVCGMGDLALSLGRAAGRGSFFYAALEFCDSGERHDNYSRPLMSLTVRKAAAMLDRILPRDVFSGNGRPGWTLAGVAAGLALALQAVFSGAGMGSVFAAVLDPGASFRAKRGANLVLIEGRRTVMAGDDVITEAIVFGCGEGDAVVMTSHIPGVWKRRPAEADTLRSDGTVFPVYRYAFKDVDTSFDYYFNTGTDSTAVGRVEVVHRPVVNRVGAVLDFPDYTAAAPETLRTLAGRIIALRGTEVRLEGEASKDLRLGILKFASGKDAGLELSGCVLEGSFVVEGDDTFTVEVVDSIGLENEAPVGYPVVSLRDRPPVVELFAPEEGATLPRSLVTTVAYRAYDDYGIAAVKLRFMREGKDDAFETIDMTPSSCTRARLLEELFEWSLGDVGVFPGDGILFYLEVSDNNTATGPGIGRTAQRRLIVPTLSNIYAQIREEEARQEEDLEDVMERGRRIRERLRKLSDDFLSEGELGWGRRQEWQEVAEQHGEMRDKIGDVADRLGETLGDLERNMATTREIGEKLEQMRRLLKRIESKDLSEAIERLRKMLGGISEDEIAASMEEIEMDAADIAEDLERTIELLKRVMREERIEELVRRMEEMLKEQRAVRDSTAAGCESEGSGETDDCSGLSEQQERMGEKADGFEEDMEEFARSESDSSLVKEIDEMLDRMREAALGERMRQAAGELEEGKREEARCTQDGTINDMLSLYTSLGRCQMSNSIIVDREVLGRIERAARELVEASKLEEGISVSLRSRSPGVDREGLIAEQLVLKSAVRRITEDLSILARKSMTLTNKVFMHLGASLKRIDSVLDGIEEQRFNEAESAAVEARTNLNLAVIEILRASSSGGGSGTGSQGDMKRLFERQTSIDQRLQSLMDSGRAGAWSMEDRARMARIAAEQRKMHEVLESMRRESGGVDGILGRVDDILDEMEDIAGRLEEGALDDVLLDREQAILGRMLESQRSIQRRDYKRDRISSSAGDVPAMAPRDWLDRIDGREVLLDRIRRAMQEKGPAEYEELIKLYFRALSGELREVSE